MQEFNLQLDRIIKNRTINIKFKSFFLIYVFEFSI